MGGWMGGWVTVWGSGGRIKVVTRHAHGVGGSSEGKQGPGIGDRWEGEMGWGWATGGGVMLLLLLPLLLLLVEDRWLLCSASITHISPPTPPPHTHTHTPGVHCRHPRGL